MITRRDANFEIVVELTIPTFSAWDHNSEDWIASKFPHHEVVVRYIETRASGE